jgi:hypothetical protein
MQIDEEQRTRLRRVRALASGLLVATGGTVLATLLIPVQGIWLMWSDRSRKPL